MESLQITKLSFFPTQIFRFDLPEPAELNQRLISLTYSERERDREGVEKSNIRSLGGWHSETKLHKSADYAELVSLIGKVTEQVSSMLGYHKSNTIEIGSMWSIINPPGSCNTSHVHPGCLWSGVYYIQAPQHSGKISFTDPRTPNIMNQAKYEKEPKECKSKVSFVPTPGRMLIFPSWLYHSVAPNLAEEEGPAADRVIISFNLNQVRTPGREVE